MAKKLVYFFGAGRAEGKRTMRETLGGKGAGLADMTSIGVPVPAGFTISTDVCATYYQNGRRLPNTLKQEIKKKLKLVENVMGAGFGNVSNPLLLSVRSGARVSMPGMMDTVLNLGLNAKTVEGLAKKTGNWRFALDSRRRFIQMYSNVVMGMSGHILEHELDKYKKNNNLKQDTDLSADDLTKLTSKFTRIVKKVTGRNFPEDIWEQLWGSIAAVFDSWETPRAITYRKLNNIAGHWGTAVNVQAMVFGNMGDDCATGVAFTRDPSTGEKVFYGEFLSNAQGEDVVAGIRTPLPINRKHGGDPKLPTLEGTMPKPYKELVRIYKKLEKHYRDMQDIEFTIQNGKLWMLQTRTGKRTAGAAIKIAVDMVREKLITKEEAIMRVSPDQIDQLLHPQLDPNAKKLVIAKGLPASPGAASGKAVFSADEAQANPDEKTVLVRLETSPDDIHGMNVAQGILTARGGMTSHAAVVARGMGKPCVAGCSDIDIDYKKQQFTASGKVVKKGDHFTIDGSTGEVILGKVPTIEAVLTGEFGTFMKWADDYRKLGVRANADTPHDAEVARRFGAKGIGLCRTEHMFFDDTRIAAVREMIMSDNFEGRKKALAKILPMQKGDFIGIFEAMKGHPVTIRLLDPPLHEFLPTEEEEIKALSKSMGVPVKKLKAKLLSLHEINPMLGHRGVRLGITYPEIYEMQVRAILEAACELTKKKKFKIVPEIMVPLVGHVNELTFTRERIVQVANDVFAKYKIRLKYLVGTMIELPRASLTADKIAAQADFFSFGTNDLTQTTFGLSRDDAGKFLPFYVENNFLEEDPFVSIDQNGVGELVKMGFNKGRKIKQDLKMGICGEHGGDPKSVKFFHRIGLDYVSCSPYRVPIARLAAAQAQIETPRKATKKVKKLRS